MNPERHARLQQIFEAAVERSRADRDPYLTDACAGDSALRREVDLLLSADAEPDSECVRVCPVCSRCYEGTVERCPADSSMLERALSGSRLIAQKYLLERRIGEGGMGAVYRARHAGLEKTFALKLISTDHAAIDWFRRSFEQEARALGALEHPNIVLVTDYGIDPRDGGVPYLVMEYLEGETLRHVLSARKRLPFPEAARLLLMIAAAIDFAHTRNIIHADLKPSNLFVSGGEIKVVDFGLARFPAAGAHGENNQAPGIGAGPSNGAPVRAGSAATASDRLCGTPPYMAPELFRFESPTPASDRFAFGVIAYQLLTGELPFGAEGCREMQAARAPSTHLLPASLRHSSRETQLDASGNDARGRSDPFANHLPVELDAPMLALLDPDRAKRPRSATVAVEAMEAAWLAAREREWRSREMPRRLMFSAVGAIAAVVLAVLIARSAPGKLLEERTVDARFAVARTNRDARFADARGIPPAPSIAVVAIDEASLAADPRPLAEWPGPIGVMIDRLFDAGAQSVALDLVLGESAAKSPEFKDAVLHHAGHLTLALESHLNAPPNASRDTPHHAGGAVIGAEAIAPPTAYLLGADAYRKLFGFVNLAEDEDHAIRHAYAAFDAHSLSLAARALGLDSASTEPFWIDYSAPPREIPIVSWKDLWNDASLDQFRGRIVIIGATFAGNNDEWPIPETVSRSKIPGVVLQAEIAHTIAANFPVRGVPSLPCFVAAGIASFFAFALALRYPYRIWISLIMTGTVAAGFLAAAFAIFRWAKWMAPVVAPEVAILIAAGAAWTLKSRLAPYPGKEP